VFRGTVSIRSHCRPNSDTDICEVKPDGTYNVEFRIANGESRAISVPAGETRVPPARDVETPGETRGRERAVKETAKTLLVGAVLAVLAAATVFMMVELLQ
jgi:hypothetical protein